MEIFKMIEGYENLYEISNFGTVRGIKSGKILSKNRLTKDGYNYVSLRKDGKAKDFNVHRLVAKTFIPNIENKETVNHIDGNKLNNHVNNLEWSTRHEQLQHAYNLGLKKPMRGCNHKSSKLTEEQISEIKSLYKRYKHGCGSVAVAKKFGVESSTILRIIKGERY